LTEPSKTRNDDLHRLKNGRDAAKMILSRYPDYGKAPPEYLAGISQLLSTMSDDVLRTMTDPRIGISAKHKFLPTQADIVEFEDAIYAKRYATRDLRQGRVPERIGYSKPEPFPKLWKAFADEADLLQGQHFEQLNEASRSLAMFGKDAARDVLKRRVAA
jgi:hypothetical protein